MKERVKAKSNSKYFVVMIAILFGVNVSLGYLLVKQSRSSLISLMQTRMLEISNTAASMIDGDALERVTPQDEGTEDYRRIMETLTYFQDHTGLSYIYCIKDEGNKRFSFGLDPTVVDPGEFGSPIVYTDALYQASLGVATADQKFYEDAWGRFYSAYSPVFDSEGKVAGIIAVDFSADWYNRQLSTLTLTIVIAALISLLIGGTIVNIFIVRSERRIGAIHGQLNQMSDRLMKEIGSSAKDGEIKETKIDSARSIADLEKQILSMQSELQTQISQVHVRAYQDSLTGVKSKHAYLEAEKDVNEKLVQGSLKEFAVVVCDVNGLKKVNDTLGHQAGDVYIQNASKMICSIFSHSPVYRTGGDEFAVLLTGRDYKNRAAFMHELHRLSQQHIDSNEVVVSGGMSEFIPGQDLSVQMVFERADTAMYQEKTRLHARRASDARFRTEDA